MPTTAERRAPGTTLRTEACARDEQRYRSLFARHPAPMLALDLQGCIVEANAAVTACFGHEPDRLQGQSLSVLIPDWDQPELLPDLARQPGVHEVVLRHAEGRRCDVEVVVVPAVSGDTGSPTRYFLIARDVTSQRRLRRKLQVQAEIIACVREPVVVLDESGHVVCWNAGGERLYGPSAKAMACQPFALLFEPPEREVLQRALADTRCGASAPTELELRRAGPQGRPAALRLSITRIAGVDRGRELWLVQGTDALGIGKLP